MSEATMTDDEIVELMARAAFDHEWRGVEGAPAFADDITEYWRACGRATLAALRKAGVILTGPEPKP
jgi:hypothetical protein